MSFKVSRREAFGLIGLAALAALMIAEEADKPAEPEPGQMLHLNARRAGLNTKHQQWLKVYHDGAPLHVPIWA